MIRHWKLLSAAALCCLTISASTIAETKIADPLDPPQGVFQDDWMIVEMAGQRLGYARGSMTRKGDHIDTELEMRLVIKRMGMKLEIPITSTTHEHIDGTPISFETRSKLAMVPMNMKGKINNGEMQITESQFGLPKRRTVPVSEDAVLTWGAYRKQMEKGLEPGTEYSVPMLMPDVGGVVRVDTKVMGREKLRLDGKILDSIRIDQKMIFADESKLAGVGNQQTREMIQQVLGEMEASIWVNQRGEALKQVVPMAGLGAMVMTRADRTSALQAVTDAPEFFLNTLVESNVEINRRKSREIKYRLTVKGEGPDMPEFPDTGMQTALANADGSVELTVRRQNHERLSRGPFGTPSEELAEYLEANSSINIEDEAVIAMAKEAAGGETNPYTLADKLRVYVTDVIKDKNLDIGFATASEVCRKKTGDCSEHGVLLAALGRVHGIPTRVVGGLVYVPAFAGTDDLFGFHMWSQFYIAGQWIDLDAAQRETDCNPTHIALSTSSLNDTGLVEMAFPMMPVLGRLQIEVISIDGNPVSTD